MNKFSLPGCFAKLNFAFVQCYALLGLVPVSLAQSYHTDEVIDGEQAVRITGNLSIEEYGAGFGGDLNVGGAVNLSTSYMPLLGLPEGVTGGYFGPIKIGESFQISEFFFSKSGDSTTGDFIAPIGIFKNKGGPIEVSIFPQGSDPMSGAAYYTLGSTQYGSYSLNGEVTALRHSAFGGGKNTKIIAYAQHGSTHLYLQFDARNYRPGQVMDFGVRLQFRSVGKVVLNAGSNMYPVENMLPVKLLNSVELPYVGDTGNTLDSSTTHISTDKTVIDGEVILSVPQGDISMGIYE